VKQKYKRKFRVFEMVVLRRTCGVTVNDRKKNDDIMNTLAIDRDTGSCFGYRD